jgi:hypothetical protein
VLQSERKRPRKRGRLFRDRGDQRCADDNSWLLPFLQAGGANMQALSVTVALQSLSVIAITLNRVRIKSECLVSQCGSFFSQSQHRFSVGTQILAAYWIIAPRCGCIRASLQEQAHNASPLKDADPLKAAPGFVRVGAASLMEAVGRSVKPVGRLLHERGGKTHSTREAEAAQRV